MSKLIDNIRKLEKIASTKHTPYVEVKPKIVMHIKGPRGMIDIYSLQPIHNQIKIIRNFMEIENAKEELRTRI